MELNNLNKIHLIKLNNICKKKKELIKIFIILTIISGHIYLDLVKPPLVII